MTEFSHRKKKIRKEESRFTFSQHFLGAAKRKSPGRFVWVAESTKERDCFSLVSFLERSTFFGKPLVCRQCTTRTSNGYYSTIRIPIIPLIVMNVMCRHR